MLSRLGFGGPIELVLPLEVDPFVELGKGELDRDLWQGENGIGDQNFVDPYFAGAGIDDSVDAVLFEHNVAPDGWGGLIFSGFDDPVAMRGAWTEDFEDDNGLIDDGRGSVDWGAHNHAVGIADVAPPAT